MSTIRVEIVSAEEEIWSGEGTMVYAPGSSGELGIAPRHTPLITQLKAGDAVNIREKAKKQLRIQSAMEIASQVGLPEWVEVDAKKMTGVLKSLPDREDILPDINENLVVELYSK